MKFVRRRIVKLRNSLLRRYLNTQSGRKLLSDVLPERVVHVAVDCDDHIMSCRINEKIGNHVYRFGNFCRNDVSQLLKFMSERNIDFNGKKLLEVGANIGTQTIYFCIEGSFESVVCLEPDPRNFALLRLNVEQNDFNQKCTLLNYAAASSNGDIDFYLHKKNHGMSSTVSQGVDDLHIKVPSKTVNQTLVDLQLVAGDFGLVWMDVEGYEPSVLLGMSEILEKRVPLYTEYSPKLYKENERDYFIETLGNFYSRCAVFKHGVVTEMDIADISQRRDQVDILFY